MVSKHIPTRWAEDLLSLDIVLLADTREVLRINNDAEQMLTVVVAGKTTEIMAHFSAAYIFLSHTDAGLFRKSGQCVELSSPPLAISENLSNYRHSYQTRLLC